MGIITKGGRIVGTRKGGRLGGDRKKSSRSVSTSTVARPLSVKAPSTKAPSPSSTSRTLTGVNVSGLTEEQKKLLKKKGFTFGSSSKAKTTVPQIAPQVFAPTKKSGLNPNLRKQLGTGALSNLFQKQDLQFSVLPGAVPGPFSLGKANNFNSNYKASNITGAGPGDREAIARSVENTKAAFKAGATLGSFAVGGGVVGAALKGVGTAAKAFGLTARAVSFLKKTKTGRNLLLKLNKARVASKARAASKVAPVASKVAKVGTVAGVAAQKIGGAVARHPVRSTLGAALAATAAVASSSNSNSQAGVVRNAVPSGSTSTSGSTSNSTQQATEPTAPVSQASTSGGSATPTFSNTNSGRSEGLSSSSTGQRSSPALVGETEQAAAANAQTISLQRASVAPTVGAAPVGETVDLAGLDQLRQRTRDLLDQHGTDAVSMPEYKANIQALLAAGVQNLRQIQPAPPEPVVETVEQADYLAQLPELEQPDIRSFMDDTRRSLGLTDMESQRIDTLQQMQVVQETYQRVIDDIKKNPNLPKGLASRRLSEVFEDQKFATNSLLAQLEMIDSQIDDANQRLNQELGIFEAQAAQDEKAYQRRIDQFGFLVDSGAIGALSDKEMDQWSAVTGMPIDAIRQLKTNAVNPRKDYGTRFETDANANVHMITYDKSNPVNVTTQNLGPLGKPSSSSSGSSQGSSANIDAYANELINNEDFKVSNVPQDIRAQVLSRRDQIQNAPYTAEQEDDIISNMMEQGLSFEAALAAFAEDPRTAHQANIGHKLASAYGVKPEDFKEKGSGAAISSFFSSLFQR